MPSLSHASRMFSDRRDLFYLPIVTSGGKAAGPGAGKGIPAPKNAAPRPGPPPVAAPAQAPAQAAPAPAPAPTAGPGTPAPVAPKWGSGATAADIVRGGRPQPPAPQVRPRSLIPSTTAHNRNRASRSFFWICQTICQTKPHTKPIHPTSTTYPHSPQSSPSRASARSPRPPPTEEAVTSPNRAPSPSPDRSEAPISKTPKTPSRGPSTARNPTRLLESLYRLPTSAASPRLTRTRAPTTDGASPHR